MIGASSSPSAVWYLTRGTGVVTLLLLTLTLVLGITEVSRWANAHFPRFVTAALHKNVSLLVMVFLGIHIVTAIGDGYVPIRWIDAVVPFGSAYKPLFLGLGTVAFDLLIALIVTSLLRKQIGYRVWRAVHWAAYACWPVAFLHGLTIGTDKHTTWMLALSLGCLATVCGAVWWRLGPATIARTHRTKTLTRGQVS
jgi:predicted ferric reductase